MSLYALLSSDQTQVMGTNDIDPSLYSSWVSGGNPKADRYRVVNMIAQPTFDSATQYVQQNGWTIFSDRVEPAWQVLSLDAGTVTINQQNASDQATMAVSDLQTALNNWPPATSAQQLAILKRVIQVLLALLRFLRNRGIV